MEEIYIKKSDLNKWVAKHFEKDLISISDLIATIEDLDYEVERLEDEIKELNQPKEEDDDHYEDELIYGRYGG